MGIAHLRPTQTSRRPLLLPLLVYLAAPALFFAQTAQQSSGQHVAAEPAERLLSARAMYYTPTVAGLRGFHCGVDFDWPKLFKSFGNPLPDDSPVLRYLRSAHLSVSDSFLAGGKLEWADTGTPPENFVQGTAQLREGMKQTLFGFLTTWNAFLNGSMVPAPDATVTFTQTPDGFRLHGVTKQYTVDEDFDKNVLLKQAHVVTDTMDVTTLPVFEQSAQGLRPSTITSVVRQPKTAAPVQSTLTITYAPVSGFEIPNLIKVAVQNLGSFDFPLSNCAVDVEKK